MRPIPDWLFFPTILMIAAAMILASIVGNHDHPRGSVSGYGDYKQVEISGQELYRVISGPDSSIDIYEHPDNMTSLIISSVYGEADVLPENSTHFRLGADLETVFAEQPIQISIEARKGPNSGAFAFDIAYSSGRGRFSGWQRFELTDNFQTYSFQWTPPALGQTSGVDYIGLKPVSTDDMRSVEIRSIYLTRL